MEHAGKASGHPAVAGCRLFAFPEQESQASGTGSSIGTLPRNRAKCPAPLLLLDGQKWRPPVRGTILYIYIGYAKQTISPISQLPLPSPYPDHLQQNAAKLLLIIVF